VATGDLVHLRRQRMLRSVWAAAVVAPAVCGYRNDALSALDGSGEVATSLPSTAMANFFDESFERRDQPAARLGERDAQLATLIT